MGIKQYINETRAEMKHVTWPTRQQTTSYTIVVILLSIIVAIYLGAFDSLFVWVLKHIVPSLGY
jgi:preprotein translocase subunit SecE